MQVRSTIAIGLMLASTSIVAATGMEPLYVGQLRPANAEAFCEGLGRDDAKKGKFSLDIVTGNAGGVSVTKSYDVNAKKLRVWITATETYKNCDVEISGLELGKTYIETGMNARLDVDFDLKSYNMVKGMQSFGYVQAKKPARMLVPVKLY